MTALTSSEHWILQFYLSNDHINSRKLSRISAAFPDWNHAVRAHHPSPPQSNRVMANAKSLTIKTRSNEIKKRRENSIYHF